jgi:hypothetical protein
MDGICSIGIEVCQANEWVCAPQNAYSGVEEICNDIKDNDCDGDVDE